MSQALMQKRNPEQIALASADLQPRYEPNFAWKGICGLYQSLPALRAFYPCSAQINSAQSGHLLSDIANNFHCQDFSAPLVGYDDLIPYIELDGIDDSFAYPDNLQFDITGTDSRIPAAQRGLTLGCWFKTDTVAAGLYTIISKYTTATDDRSYLIRQTADAIIFRANALGTLAGNISVTSTVTIDTTQWHLVIGRLVPGTTQDIFVDGTETSLAAGVPASIHSGAAEFNIGAENTHLNSFFDGKISMVFICASALSDSIIGAIWQQTRAMYRR